MAKTPFLSVCMIVKNEEKILEKSLRSLQGIWDELIIVDTGSTDSTVEIAKKYADKVDFMEWKDDFGAGRTFSIGLAQGEFILIWDADFILEEGSREKLIELKKKRFNGYNQVFLNWITEFEERTLKVQKSILRDLIYRKKDFVWKSPIHTHMVPKWTTRVKAGRYPEIKVFHWKDPVAKGFRYGQTLRILEKTLADPKLEAGEKLRLRLFYAQDLIFEKKFEEAVPQLLEVLNKSGKWSDESRIFVLEKLAVCYFSLGKATEIYDLVQSYSSKLGNYSRYKLLLADTCVFTHPEKALALYKNYLEKPLKLAETGWDYDVFRFGSEYPERMLRQVQEMIDPQG